MSDPIARQRFDHLTHGPAALVGAVIRLATWDATEGRPALQLAAWQYFMGEGYREHLAWLGVDRFRLPEELKRWN